MTSVQVVVARPRTAAGLTALVDRRALLDLAGRTLVRQACSCGGWHLGGEPCHVEVRCPDCRSTARTCKRPSGHDAQTWHNARWAEYERVTAARAAAGDLTLPAPWAPEPDGTP
jgi:hypothetical protein